MNISNVNEFDFVDNIILQKVNTNLIKYSLFIKYLLANATSITVKELASKIYRNSRLVPNGALAAIFSDPSFSYWIYLSSCIKNRLENKESIPTEDLPYCKGISNPDPDRLLEYHLLECHRFIFSAAIISRTEIDGELLFLEGALYLPFLGFQIKNKHIESTCQASFRIQGSKSFLFIDKLHDYQIDEALLISEVGCSHVEERNNISIQPSILGSGGKIIVDRIDPFIRMGWSMTYKNPDGSSYIQLDEHELNKIMPLVLKAFSMIQDSWVEMARNISATIRMVHIVRSPFPDLHMSCSNHSFFGSILVSTGDEYQLAEAFVHEYSHNILDRIIETGELFDGDIPTDEIFYSPWRNDKRHISGVLHAVFVFSNVAELLERLTKNYNSEYINIRKLDNLVRLVMGMEVLKEYPFNTPLAKSLIKDLEIKIYSLKSKYSDVDFSSSLSLQMKHLKNWISTHSDNGLPESLKNYSYWS
jgi:HEXXH motif-containing protein